MSGLPEHITAALDELEACCNRSWTGFAHEKRLELEAEIARCVEALNRIASWKEGQTVKGSFDEPYAAEIARAALAPLPEVSK